METVLKRSDQFTMNLDETMGLARRCCFIPTKRIDAIAR